MNFGERINGVLRLKAATFEEIEADRSATGQALAIVIVASLATGIGEGALFGPLRLMRETFAALVGWGMWATVTYFFGRYVMPEPDTKTDMGELLRVIGFAYAPSLFNVFGVIPFIGELVTGIAALWALAATIIAVRQALDYRSTLRAVCVVFIGWLVFVAIVRFG